MASFFDIFKLGFSKIAYLDVFVHLLFITALCGIYTFKSSRMVSWFVLCFTGGYLITFLLTTFDYISFPLRTLDFLMPLTVLVTAIGNFFLKRNAFINRYPSQTYRYYLAFGAGIIHGMAFPEILKPLLSPDNLVSQVIAFNMGIIFALALIVFFLLFITFFLTYFIRLNIREWNLTLSGACAGIAVYIIMTSIFYEQWWR